MTNNKAEEMIDELFVKWTNVTDGVVLKGDIIDLLHAYGALVIEAALHECERYKFTDAGWRTDLTGLKHRIRNLKLP